MSNAALVVRAPVTLAPAPAVVDPLAAFARDLAPRTRRAYAADLAEFFAFLGLDPSDTATLRLVTPAHVAEYAAHVSKRDATGTLANAATVARKLSSVRSAFNWLRACGVLEGNPAAFVRSPRVSAQSPRQGLSKGEARAMVDGMTGVSVKALRDRAILLVMLYGGLRRAEVSALRIGDLYEERGYSVAHVRGKGGKVRTVPLKVEAVRAVAEYLEADGRTGAGADVPLFVPTRNNRTGKTDRAMTPGMVWYVVREAAARAGIIKRISPHSLRHTAITLALDGGAKVERVQAFAGHADPKTTIRYFRTAADLDQSAAHAITF